jgi:hypothetical protein
MHASIYVSSYLALVSISNAFTYYSLFRFAPGLFNLVILSVLDASRLFNPMVLHFLFTFEK